MPQAWADLTEAIGLLARHPSDPDNPLYCEHDRLVVLADDTKFTDDELTRLSRLGFDVAREGGFYSYRFGSA